MLVLFEVHLAAGADPGALITKDTMRETNAQLMTPAEAKKVGFDGLPEMGDDVVLVAVAKRDASWIHRQLEGNDAVARFKTHDVG